MYIISFPRSGQRLTNYLLRHIHRYYGKEYSYCGVLNCCNENPCKNERLFRKSHDFKLNLELKLDEKAIILYRKDKIYQLESYFRWEKYNKDNFISDMNYEDESVFNRLIECIKKRSTYYDGFVNKYIKSNTYKQALIIEYDYFLSNDKDCVKQIILYLNLTDNENINSDVDKIVKTFEKIEYKNRLDDEMYNKIKNKLDQDHQVTFQSKASVEIDSKCTSV